MRGDNEKSNVWPSEAKVATLCYKKSKKEEKRKAKLSLISMK